MKYSKYLYKLPLFKQYNDYRDRELGVIYMLHRVAPFENDKLFPNENMKISPAFLERTILELRNQDYVFLSLDELYDMLRKKKFSRKKFAVFTLDDGYVDNFTNAYPIFEKHEVPFATYICTDFPDNKAILWWYLLEDLITQNDSIELFDGSVFYANTKKEKENLFMDLRALLLQVPKKEFHELFFKMFLKYRIDAFAKTAELSMSWEQIISMSKSSFCTIAGHSVSHPNFKLLSEKEIENEIIESKNIIEQHIGKPVDHFAYPFGSFDENMLEFIDKISFKTVTTTENHTIKVKHRKRLYSLPRKMLTELKNENFTY
jgi:peptidoglycan/xylan/chitin deacetylase (PgdA/CDA1 family)